MTISTGVALNAADPYVVVHYDLGSAKAVLFADAVGLRRTTDGNVYADFRIQYSTDDVAWTDFGAPFTPGKPSTRPTTRRRTGPVTARYWRVAKTGANNYGGALFQMEAFALWQEGTDLSDSRVVDFEFSTEQRYAILFTDRNARVYVDRTYQCDIRTNYTSAQLATLNWTQSLDSLITVQPDVEPMWFQRQGSDTEWNSESLPFDFIPKYPFAINVTKPAATLTPSAVSGNVTLTASAAVFLSSHIGQFVWGNLGGARITDYVSTTVVKAVVTLPFFDTTAIAANSWTLETGYEDVWSATRGWPAAAIFYQNRLVLGGSDQLPNGFGGSRINEYFNFDPAQALDDDAFFVVIQSNDVPAILNFRAERHLQIFTTAAEYFVPIPVGAAAITPRNVSVRRSTAYGSRAGVRPQNVSGASVFLQRGGKAYREFVYVDTEDAYVANELSLLSSHLIKTPVDLALRKATNTDDANLLLSVNSDGTLAICVTMREQEITAWSPQETDGLYKRVGAVDTDAYAVVERTIGGVARRYFEKFDTSLYLDCAVSYGAGGPVFSGLDHLEGETVKVRADDSVLTDEVVASGQVTADRAAASDCHIGLDFTPTVEILPGIYEDGAGTRLDGKTRISRVCVDLYETQNLLIEGERVNFRQFGGPIDTAPPIFTGRKKIGGLLGWADSRTITFTQDAPAPITMRALEYQLRG